MILTLKCTKISKNNRYLASLDFCTGSGKKIDKKFENAKDKTRNIQITRGILGHTGLSPHWSMSPHISSLIGI